MSLNEKCGIFGIFGKDLDVARLTFFGLFALQHRGQESSGIAAANGYGINCYKNVGLVTHVYSENDIKTLTGYLAIGHNRYSTSEGTGLKHAQPVIARDGLLALAHNGNLPSVKVLTKFLEGKDISTNGSNDSELMAKAIGYYLEHRHNLKEAVTKAFPLFTGVFSLLAMTKDTLVAVRDRCGVRPLVMGQLDGGVVFASESCAFKTVGAKFVREVQPGELVVVTENGVESLQVVPPDTKVDIFEFVYFARPDSEILGQSVYEVRRKFGMQLAKEYKVSADIVVPVPETAIPVAIGYSQKSDTPMEMALIKNRYIHRTFIEPEQHLRDSGAQMKLNPLPQVLKNKRVVLIDDSIVRGTTSRKLIQSLFEAGAKEVHFLVSSPPLKYPDFYGIDTPKQQDLIASHKTVEEIKDFLGATSLYYLSLEGMIASTGLSKNMFNTSCFTGEYPVDLQERAKEFQTPAYELDPTEVRQQTLLS